MAKWNLLKNPGTPSINRPAPGFFSTVDISVKPYLLKIKNRCLTFGSVHPVSWKFRLMDHLSLKCLLVIFFAESQLRQGRVKWSDSMHETFLSRDFVFVKYGDFCLVYIQNWIQTIFFICANLQKIPSFLHLSVCLKSKNWEYFFWIIDVRSKNS